jgi:hypothetical protein
MSGQASSVELELQPWPAAVLFAQAGDERVDLDGTVVVGGGETTHSLQSPGSDLVMARPGRGEFVLDESPVDG